MKRCTAVVEFCMQWLFQYREIQVHVRLKKKNHFTAQFFLNKSIFFTPVKILNYWRNSAGLAASVEVKWPGIVSGWDQSDGNGPSLRMPCWEIRPQQETDPSGLPITPRMDSAYYLCFCQFCHIFFLMLCIFN